MYFTFWMPSSSGTDNDSPHNHFFLLSVNFHSFLVKIVEFFPVAFSIDSIFFIIWESPRFIGNDSVELSLCLLHKFFFFFLLSVNFHDFLEKTLEVVPLCLLLSFLSSISWEFPLFIGKVRGYFPLPSFSLLLSF